MNTEMPFISIVMPCYNVAQYVESAVDSVIRQKASITFEIILVDDASSDGQTLQKCRKLAKLYECVRCIEHGENRGLSETRNTGFQEALGSYVIFLDPDDTLLPGLFAALEDSISKNESDVIVWGAIEDHYAENGEVSFSRSIPTAGGHCEGVQDIARMALSLEQATLLGYAWNKAYRTDFLKRNGIRFKSIQLVEDILFNVEVMRHASSVFLLEECYYRYARRMAQGESLTAKHIPRYFELSSLRIESLCSLCKEAGAYDDYAKGILGAAYVRYALSALWRNRDKRSGMDAQQQRKWLEDFYNLPLSEELLSAARPKGLAARMIAALFRMRSVSLLLGIAAVVDGANRHAPGGFARMRQSR